MTFKQIALTLSACHLAMLPGLAQAQSSSFDRAYAPQGAEARFSLTIPLGESSSASKTAPRLDFGVRNYAQSSDISLDWMRNDEPNYREMRLGFTLEDSPQLMMNERVIVMSEDEQANIGTAGKIGLTVVAVALVGVTVIAVAFASCDPNCFDDE